MRTAYESAFDRFEILVALEYMHQTEHAWGLLGRFAWKHEPNPLDQLITEAKQQESAWPPLVAGFFGGSLSRFEKLAMDLKAQISKAGWSW
jgi:hypothetical protein